VRVCLAYAGIFGIPESFRTGNMPEYLLKTGVFVELKESKYTTRPDYLGYGDILVTKASGHTVVVISDGALFEGPVQPKAYALGERDLGRGDEGEDVRLLQQYLLQLNYSVGEYGADGDFGKNTLAGLIAFQTAKGLTADGVYGDADKAALEKAYAAIPSTPATPTTDDEKAIWDRLYAAIQNPYGVAGIMGNFKAESNLRGNNL
jgi:hypothetical protein